MAAESLGVNKLTLAYWIKEQRRKHGPINATEETALQKQVKELQRETEAWVALAADVGARVCALEVWQQAHSPQSV